MMHWIQWVKTRLKVINKSAQKVPFIPNRAQLRLYALMEKQRELGHPIRIIVLKSRRQGITTGFQAYAFARCQNNPNTFAFVCAHDTDSSQDIFGMNTLFEKELPEEERKMKQRSSRREIIWASPHYSKYQVQTAGNVNIKRGAALHVLHASEFAFYKHPKKIIQSAFNAVPSLPDTAVLIESTANGVGNEFYERWQSAVQHFKQSNGSLDGYVPIFFGWLDDPDNVLPIPKSYQWGTASQEEDRLIGLGATNEQIYWRRWKISNDYNGDTEKFHEDYPATPSDAFRYSGRPAIPRNVIDYHRKTVEIPKKCRLVWDTNAPRGVRPEWGDFQTNYWQIWRKPKENHGYTCGGDIATGELAIASDPRSDADRNASIILDRRELEFVAARISREAPDIFGEEMVKAALWYNVAWATPEVNGPGMAALGSFRRSEYPNVYQRESGIDDLEYQIVQKLGWYTSGGNRDQMIDDFIAACRPDWRVMGEEKEPNLEGKVICHWDEMVDEEEVFEVTTKGKRKHRDGQHDDILFAAFIAWQLHLRCPRSDGSTIDVERRPQSMMELNAPNARDRQTLMVSSGALETS